MKIFGRNVVFPICVHRTHTIFCEKPNLAIHWGKTKMSGSVKTTEFTLEIRTKKATYQWSFVWRPDVTNRSWKRR